MDQRAPLVTIGMPTYNGARYLAQSLDSLLAQDYPNWELVISDNCSTDGTEAIARSYAAQHPQIRYVRSPLNRGAAANFNRVLGISPNSPTQVVKNPIPVEIVDVDIPKADKTAKAQRPEIKMQQASISASKSNIDLQRTGAKPSLGLSGAYNYVSAQSFSTSNISYNALATLNIPIWDGGVTKARVDQAYADLYSATDTLEQVELVISQEVSTAALVLEEAAKRTKTTADNVTLAEEALRLANVRYEAGIAVLVEVTNAESQLTQPRFNQVNAQYDYAIALAELERVTASQPELAKLRLIDYKPVLDMTSKPAAK